jgi:hypothetical protein
VLVLPVATAGVERVFSSMNYIKNKLRSKMGQEYLNDCLVTLKGISSFKSRINASSIIFKRDKSILHP